MIRHRSRRGERHKSRSQKNNKAPAPEGGRDYSLAEPFGRVDHANDDALYLRKCHSTWSFIPNCVCATGQSFAHARMQLRLRAHAPASMNATRYFTNLSERPGQKRKRRPAGISEDGSPSLSCCQNEFDEPHNTRTPRPAVTIFTDHERCLQARRNAETISYLYCL